MLSIQSPEQTANSALVSVVAACTAGEEKASYAMLWLLCNTTAYLDK